MDLSALNSNKAAIVLLCLQRLSSQAKATRFKCQKRTIAKMAGISLSTVSRALGVLTAEGYIAYTQHSWGVQISLKPKLTAGDRAPRGGHRFTAKVTLQAFEEAYARLVQREAVCRALEISVPTFYRLKRKMDQAPVVSPAAPSPAVSDDF